MRTTGGCLGLHGLGSSAGLCDSARQPVQFAGNSSLGRSSRSPDLWQVEMPDLAMLFLKSDIATGMDL